jgi:ATP-dependent Clp protease protease subunit
LNTIVYEETEHGDVPLDVYQKLSNNRILFVTGGIDDDLASDITATLLLKDQEDPDKKITLFINSWGGDLRNVFMIYDMIQMINAPVETVCIGEALSEAAILLVAGDPGSRFATKNSMLCISQLEMGGHAHTDMINAKKWLDLFTEDNQRMMKIFAEASGKSVAKVMEDFDRPVFMSAAKAVKYGLIDKVITLSK